MTKGNKKDNIVESISRKENIEILNFCTTIEIRSHDISGLVVNGTDFYVKYGKNFHSVTSQSYKQKSATKKFLESTISFSPFTSNIIWFTQI